MVTLSILHPANCHGICDIAIPFRDTLLHFCTNFAQEPVFGGQVIIILQGSDELHSLPTALRIFTRLWGIVYIPYPTESVIGKAWCARVPDSRKSAEVFLVR